MTQRNGWLIGLGVLAAPAIARAQADVRLIRPDVMLLLDTSGSMEWMPGQDGTPPVCNPSNVALRNDRNRWNVAVEVLTGTYEDYRCQEEPRDDSSRLDYNYYIPHYSALFSSQDADGVIDEYRERVKFGLMTFDSYAGLPDFAFGVETDADGMWSYGDDRRLFCADCTANYTWNAGARNESAPEGALVSCGAGTDDSGVLDGINARVQTEILSSKPYWATPIAAMLDDADFYYDNNPDVNPLPNPDGNDPYHQCRDHYVLLVTDGAPNVDGRPFCERGGCECPWLPADEEAREVYDPLAADPDQRPVLVIGYDVPDLATRRILWDVADGGGTALPCADADLCPGGDPTNCPSDITCPTDDGHPGALFAGCRDVDAPTCASRFRSALSTMLDFASPDSTTRTRPTFTNAVGGSTHGQYQFNSAFNVSSGSPWRGVLQRNRWECLGSTPTPVPFDGSGNADSDDFAAILNKRNLVAKARKLLTAIPRTATVGADMQSSFTRANATADSEAFRVANGAVSQALLGVTTPARRQLTIDWMHGEATSRRANYRLGDIFHSNPAILAPPELNLPDASFRAFQTKVVSGAKTAAERPTILYVGSNDGILHAFDAKTGEELWGFVPPYLVPKVERQVETGHMFGVDGGVVARDILPDVSETTLPTGDDWRTIVVFGLRQGGGAYVALDVTDWQNPKFLWQFAPGTAVMGDTYAAPQIGTVFVKEGGTEKEKAVAILTGGSGTPIASGPAGCPRGGSGTDIRGNVRCWEHQGRYLWVVELETGTVMEEFDWHDFDAPLVGTPALYQSQPGTALRRIFVTDTEGTLYRVDVADQNSNRWEVDRVFDLYHGRAPNDSVPSYEEPLLTVNDERELVVVYGSGDPDNLAGAGRARVASVTEELTLNGSGSITAVDMTKNWELDLPDLNEKLTGPMQLFDGALYFTTFIPATTSTNLCALGHGRVWGVDVIDREAGGMPKPLWDRDGNPATADFVHFADLLDNTVVFGVGITRRPSCAVEDAIIDDFGRNRTRLTSATPGDYKLVIQSGPGAPGPGWDESPGAGGGPNVFERSLQAPERPITVMSWVNVIED